MCWGCCVACGWMNMECVRSRQSTNNQCSQSLQEEAQTGSNERKSRRELGWWPCSEISYLSVVKTYTDTKSASGQVQGSVSIVCYSWKWQLHRTGADFRVWWVVTGCGQVTCFICNMQDVIFAMSGWKVPQHLQEPLIWKGSAPPPPSHPLKWSFQTWGAVVRRLLLTVGEFLLNMVLSAVPGGQCVGGNKALRRGSLRDCGWADH